MYKAYIVKIENLRKHTNADRLQIATVFGNDVCVDLSAQVGDMMIYFPTDGQLSEDYCNYNNLVRKKDEHGNEVGGYMDPEKRNVKTIRLRGEKSDGLLMPLKSLDYFKHHDLEVGEVIEGLIDGVEICTKYIPKTNTRRGAVSNGNKTRKKKVPIAPLFMEHADTEQLAYNLGAFRPNDEVEITLKMHGTSQRTGYLPRLKKMKRSLLDILLRRDGTPIYEWGYVTGTRRTVLDGVKTGYYNSEEFRDLQSAKLEGKLLKGETVYYEVVGWVNNMTPIMGAVQNKKLNDKDFVKKYGDTTIFSYGCEPGESEMYVYRMTMTNEDGDVVEYTPDYMRYRCEQMGVKTVPVFTKFIIPEFTQLPDDVGSLQDIDAGEYVKNIAEKFYAGEDPVGKTHIREGVVCRIINRPKFCAYKHKAFEFKVLEGIVKESASAPDMEEAQEVAE